MEGLPEGFLTWQELWADFEKNVLPGLLLPVPAGAGLKGAERNRIRQVSRDLYYGDISDSRRIRECLEKYAPGRYLFFDGGWVNEPDGGNLQV